MPSHFPAITINMRWYRRHDDILVVIQRFDANTRWRKYRSYLNVGYFNILIGYKCFCTNFWLSVIIMSALHLLQIFHSGQQCLWGSNSWNKFEIWNAHTERGRLTVCLQPARLRASRRTIVIWMKSAIEEEWGRWQCKNNINIYKINRGLWKNSIKENHHNLLLTYNHLYVYIHVWLQYNIHTIHNISSEWTWIRHVARVILRT